MYDLFQIILTLPKTMLTTYNVLLRFMISRVPTLSYYDVTEIVICHE